MKYPSATEVLSELLAAKESGNAVWWKDIISIPLDKVSHTGKLQVLYKGKPLYVTIKEEQVIMGSSSNNTFDYCASVKLAESDTSRLVELIFEIVKSTMIAYKSLSDPSVDVDPIMQHVSQGNVVKLTANDFTSRVKEYNGIKYLDLKLYPSYVTVRDKEGISEETLTQDDLKDSRKVNKVFKVGSRVSCIMIIYAFISERYISVVSNVGTQVYVDQRKVKSHFTSTQIKQMFDISLSDKSDDEIDTE